VNNRHIIRPGRPAGAIAPVHAPNAALLIDFDNVTLGIRSDLTKELRTLLNSDIIKGKVAVQRAYADWRRYPQYIVPLSESSIDLIFAPAFGTNKKNATDIRLAVDAIELVFTRPEIGTFILLSGDSDFSSMVIKLKEYGKYVIGVGIRESASDLLIQNCDEYYSYSDLAGLTREEDKPSVQRDPWELVREAAAQMTRNDDVMRSDRLKQVMKQIDPNFDEKNAGYSRFSKFVTDAGARGILVVKKMENGQYEISPVAGGVEPKQGGAAGQRGSGAAGAQRVAPADRPVQEEKKGRGRRRGRGGRGRGEDRPASEAAPAAGGRKGLSLAGSFQLMAQALAELPNPVPHETLRARMAALHGREDALLEAARFARLLRQANDAEVADVRKVGEDDYEVSVHPTDIMVPRQRPAAPSPERSAAPLAAPEGNGAASAPPAAMAPPAAAVRFRRGTRLGTHKPEIPMVGVVVVDDDGGAEGQGGSGDVKKKSAKPPKARAEKPAAAPKKKAARAPRAKKAE